MAKVFLTPQAQKDFKKISQKDKVKVRKGLSLLHDQPLAGQKLKGKLAGLYSLRIWPYRTVYLIQNNQIWVVHLLHRQGAYK